jgi:hypothetical protein
MEGLRVFLYDANTNYDGGVCGPAAGACDPFGEDVTLTSSWTPYVLLFSALTQQGWGEKFSGVDPSTLYAMNFQTPTGQAFDFEIDDIYFIAK